MSSCWRAFGSRRWPLLFAVALLTAPSKCRERDSGSGTFTIDTSTAGERQVFEGVMVEIQSDSIGSNNHGMPEETTGVPHDLVPSERQRMAEVLRGTRYIRLALGLYLRGLSADGRNIVGRWPEQMSELKQLHEASGVEGWAPEYWSPPPHWKSTDSWYNGTLRSFEPSFLEDFCDAVVDDIRYLEAQGLPVSWWGLQNEPNGRDVKNITRCNSSEDRTDELALPGAAGGSSYSQCSYSQCNYKAAFSACATKVRAHNQSIRIHANSATGQLGASPIANDPSSLKLVDAFTWHFVNQPSSATFRSAPWRYGKLDFTNEMEWQPGSPYSGTAVGTVALLNSFLNTLTFKDAPTGVISLHLSKPTTNLEALGYGWTWWRPTDSSAAPAFPELRQNHFEFNFWNWAAVSPFIKTVPWNARRRHVEEELQLMKQRVVAFETPPQGSGGPLHANTVGGKLIVVLTNEEDQHEGDNEDFPVTVKTTDKKLRVWEGFQYQGSANGSGFNVSLGNTTSSATGFSTVLPPATIQWWYER